MEKYWSLYCGGVSQKLFCLYATHDLPYQGHININVLTYNINEDNVDFNFN